MDFATINHSFNANLISFFYYEMQFNCFLLMPVVDKLPALLREDLESALEDDLDSIFDVTQMRRKLGHQKRELEIELKRVFFFIML